MTLAFVIVVIVATFALLSAWQCRVERDDALSALARTEILPVDETTFVRVHVQPLREVVETLRLIERHSDDAIDLHVDVSDLDDSLDYLEERLRSVSGVEI